MVYRTQFYPFLGATDAPVRTITTRRTVQGYSDGLALLCWNRERQAGVDGRFRQGTGGANRDLISGGNHRSVDVGGR